jgi:acid phosphatase (class A)
MKPISTSSLCFRAAALAALLLTAFVAPVRADDLMAEPARAAQTKYLHFLAPKKPDVIALLAPPPLLDSPEQAADMATVRQVYHAAGSNDVAAAYSEKKFSVYNFAPAVGSFFQSNNLPQTTAFFEHVQTDAAIVTDGAKLFYKRPRPFVTDPTLVNGQLEKSFSYPSGHSTESMVLALVLAEVFPDRSDAIIATARGIGWRRVEIARHYPTDIYAGRVLARAIVGEMNASPEFQKEIAAVEKEISEARHAAMERSDSSVATRH